MNVARFDFHATPIAGVYRAVRKPIGDERGFLARLYCRDEFAGIGGDFDIAQVNHTLTRKQGAIRGLHYQRPPHAEIKLVTCLKGEVFDVAVDLRRDSPTFLEWFGTRLAPDNATALLIPRGCAHGFQALSGDCELIYLHSAAYAAEADAALNVLDPGLAIEWPLPPGEMSARDRGHAMIGTDYQGVVL